MHNKFGGFYLPDFCSKNYFVQSFTASNILGLIDKGLKCLSTFVKAPARQCIRMSGEIIEGDLEQKNDIPQLRSRGHPTSSELRLGQLRTSSIDTSALRKSFLYHKIIIISYIIYLIYHKITPSNASLPDHNSSTLVPF